MYFLWIRESGNSWIEWFTIKITHEVAALITTRVIFSVIFRVINSSSDHQIIFWRLDLSEIESPSKMVRMTVGRRPQFIMMWNSALGCLNVLKTWQLLSLEKMIKRKNQCLFSLCHTVTSSISFIRSKSLSPAHMETRLHFVEARVSKNCENIPRSPQWYQSEFSRETEPTGHLSI